MSSFTRKDFLKIGALGLSAVSIFNTVKLPALINNVEPLDPTLVQEFVRYGHHNLDGVTQMLNEHPTLINAAWDWGNGDFETALGGASHMGEKEIAEYLISKGSRLDIFTAAMLGNLDVIKAIAKIHSASLHSKGPHGITLLMHAQKGESENVIEYLKSQGITK